MTESIAIALVIAAAGFLQGMTGFGFALIALPLLGLFLPFKTIIPMVVPPAVCISLVLSIQLRRSIRYKNVVALMITMAPGIPLGVYVLTRVPAQYLSLGLGLIMMAFTSYQLIAKPKPRQLGVIATMLAGLLSGILSGSISAGGPPVIIYANLQPWTKNEAKSTLAFCFLLAGVLTVANHAANGLITPEIIRHILVSLPALAIGIGAGFYAYNRISDHGYRKLAFILVFLLGLMMTVKSL